MRLLLRLFMLFLLALLIVACDSIPLAAQGALSPTTPPSGMSATALAACPLTVSNGSTPPGARPSPDHHGANGLWVDLWPESKVLATPSYVLPDGSIRMKYGWYREVPGKLTIEGRRLDAPAPPLQADIPEGYGDRGFQVSDIIFPTEGCWEITAKVGAVSLTVVNLIVKVPG